MHKISINERNLLQYRKGHAINSVKIWHRHHRTMYVSALSRVLHFRSLLFLTDNYLILYFSNLN